MDQMGESNNQVFYYDYSILPHTIIQQIFSNLSLKDFNQCRRTCKSWYSISLHPKFTLPLEFSLDENNITAVSLMNRKYRKVKLNYLNFTHHNVFYLNYFKKFGEHIQQLNIHKCGFEINQIIAIFKYLNNLTRLEIDECNNFFNSKALYSNKINRNERATILRNLSNIKWLRLTSNNMNYETLEKFLTNLTGLEYLEFLMLANPKCAKNFEKFVNILPKLDMTKIKELAISIENSEEIRLEAFVGVDTSNIKSLKLKLAGIVDSTFMWDVFCNKFSGLEEFSIDYNHSVYVVNNETVLPRYISQYMVNLKRLYITKIRSIFETIFRLEHLEVLHITSCMKVDRYHYGTELERDINVDLIFIQLLPKLKSFSFDFIVRESTLEKLAEFCPNLENLELKVLTTLNCEPIFKSLTKLRKLRILFAPWILVDLSKNKGVEIDKIPEYTISRLVLLEELYVNHMVPGITEADLKKLARLHKALIPLFSMNNKKIHNFNTKFN